MIKKIENCTYCGEKMDSVRASKKFCSHKCRVYWHREQPRKPKSILATSVYKNRGKFQHPFLQRLK